MLGCSRCSLSGVFFPRLAKRLRGPSEVTPLYTYCSTCGTHKHMALSWNVCLPSPEWPIWHTDQERALLWIEEERHAYSNPAFGQDVRILQPHSTAPTLLHSYASPLDSCPCGCRRQGFARSSLLSRGLRGFGLLSCVLGGPRYLHPQEAALLCTLPVSRLHVSDVKAALCLLGQLAAPLHALWILAQVQSWFADQAALPAVDLQPLLVQYKRALLRERHNAWLLPPMMKGGFLTLSRVDLQVPRFQVRRLSPVLAPTCLICWPPVTCPLRRPCRPACLPTLVLLHTPRSMVAQLWQARVSSFRVLTSLFRVGCIFCAPNSTN